MGGQDGPAGGRIAEAVQDRDTLGRPQDHIKGGDGVAAVLPAEQLAGGGVAALNIRWKLAGDASPCSPRLLAPAPYQRPGDSPWPDRYAWWSVASSRV
jgi:hypothetical protein